MKHGYQIKEINDIRCITIPELENIGYIKHSFIVKQKDADSEGNGVLKEIAARVLEIEKENIATINQTHSDSVLIYKSERIPDEGKGYDAHITSLADTALGIVTADCVPILIADKKRRIVGAVHAGWRGTAKRIVQNTVKKMSEHFGSKPEDLTAGIGPAIGQCCYEVDEKVIEPMKKEFNYLNRFSIQNKKNKWLIDLQLINKEQLIETGLETRNINIVNLCTSCYSDMFYSYRRDGAGTERMMAVVMIK